MRRLRGNGLSRPRSASSSSAATACPASENGRSTTSWTGGPTSTGSPDRCPSRSGSVWATCGWASRPRACPGAKPSVSSSRRSWRSRRNDRRSTSSTSRRSVSTRPTSRDCSTSSMASSRRGTPSSSSSTTRSSWPAAIGSSNWGRAAAPTAGASSRPGRQKPSRPERPRPPPISARHWRDGRPGGAR